MKKPVSIAFVTVLMVLFVACTKPAETAGGFDWPVWRGPDGNGQSRETEWDPTAIANPNILWKADIGNGYSNVVIQDGRLYTAGAIPKSGFAVSCVDAATGRRIWRRSFTSYSHSQATPTVDGDWLIVLTAEGYLYGIDSRNGKQLWRRDLVSEYGAVRPTYGFAGSPVVEGDLVLLTANTAGMAVKRDTGELVWTSDPPPKHFKSADRMYSTGTGYSTPVVYDGPTGRQGILAGWNGISSVDVRTGRPSWLFGWDAEPVGSSVDPIIAGDTLCMAYAFVWPLDQSGFMLKMGEKEPRLLWRTSELYTQLGFPLIIGEYLYAGFDGPVYSLKPQAPSLRCFRLSDGRMLWEEPVGQPDQQEGVHARRRKRHPARA